jgi:hypothetical protein
MSRLNEEQQRQLVSELFAAVKKFAPDWTGQSDEDPGIKLLGLLGWLSELVDYRLEKVSDRKADLLKHLIDQLWAKYYHVTCTSCEVKRPRFFTGQLLTAADLQAEQDYVLNKLRLHNRCLFGSGIVTGLNVTLDSRSTTLDEPVVTVSPGCAIDPCGEQLVVCEPLRCVLHAAGKVGYAILHYAGRPIDPVPTPSGTSEFSRVEEGVAVDLEEKPSQQGVVIARLKIKARRWLVDSRFRPPRIKLHS